MTWSASHRPVAKRLQDRIDTPVLVLEQATDPRVFFPDRGDAPAHELLFVANSRGVQRKIIDDLLPTRHQLAVYGSRWKGLIPRRNPACDARAQRLAATSLLGCWDCPQRSLGGHAQERFHLKSHLRRARLRRRGRQRPRSLGIEERFGDAVVTYETKDELRDTIERLLADPASRAARGVEERERVLAAHTFAHRYRHILPAIDARMAELGRSARIAA